MCSCDDMARDIPSCCSKANAVQPQTEQPHNSEAPRVCLTCKEPFKYKVSPVRLRCVKCVNRLAGIRGMKWRKDQIAKGRQFKRSRPDRYKL